MLTLWIEDQTRPELAKTEFSYLNSLQPMRAVRGKTAGAFSSHDSFQWTSAVQALTILLVEVVLNSEKSSSITSYPILSGHNKGFASALDYAIGRDAAWLVAIFGADANGQSRARRIFHRSNPERKRPGPVSIGINATALEAKSIHIIWDGKPARSNTELAKLQSRLLLSINLGSDHLSLSRNSSPASKESTQVDDQAEPLAALFETELRNVLSGIDIFNKNRFHGAIAALQTNPSFRKLSGTDIPITSELDWKLTSAQRMGVDTANEAYQKILRLKEPLNFGITPSQLGSLAILLYLQKQHKLPININYQFAHTVELARHVQNGGQLGGQDGNTQSLDCCVLSTASAAPLMSSLKSLPYRPLMVMPGATHQILTSANAPQGSNTISSGEYLLLNEFPTTPSFFFDELERQGTVNRKRVKVSHLDPDETTRRLQAGDPDCRAILWFPYNVLNEVFTQSRVALTQESKVGSIVNVLFVRADLLADEGLVTALDIVLRDAWLSLRENPELLRATIKNLLLDKEYIKLLGRYSGLYNLGIGLHTLQNRGGTQSFAAAANH